MRDWQAEQVVKCRGKWEGASADGLMRGSVLAVGALGQRARHKNSGLVAFAYLWRRFGPPWHGSDPHKDLCSYTLTTPNPDVLLRIYPSASALVYGVGYMARRHFRADHQEPHVAWHERLQAWWLAQDPTREAMEPQAKADACFHDIWVEKDGAIYAKAVAAIGKLPLPPTPERWRRKHGPVHEVNAALDAALRDMLRPVFVRDVAINILGRVADADVVNDVEASPYAGYGMPRRALDRRLAREKADAAT